MRTFGIILAFIGCLVLSSGSYVQSEEKAYCSFIYHFTKYTQWPETMGSGDFIIGVVNSPSMKEELENLAAVKTVNGRKIVIKEYSSGAIGACHILFIPKAETGKLADYLKTAKSNSSLVITEAPGATSKGSIINFISTGSRVKFELHLSNAQEHKLKISSSLQKLSIIVG